jgi:hypothetical protein
VWVQERCQDLVRLCGVSVRIVGRIEELSLRLVQRIVVSAHAEDPDGAQTAHRLEPRHEREPKLGQLPAITAAAAAARFRRRWQALDRRLGGLRRAAATDRAEPLGVIERDPFVVLLVERLPFLLVEAAHLDLVLVAAAAAALDHVGRTPTGRRVVQQSARACVSEAEMHLSDIDVPPARAEQAAEQAAAGGRVGASVCITTHQTFFAVVKTSILSGTSPTAPAAHGSAAIGGQAACRLGQRRTQIAPAPSVATWLSRLKPAAGSVARSGRGDT